VGYVQVAELCAGGAVSERTVRAAPSVEALDVAVLPGAAPLDVGGLGTDNRRRAKRSVSALLTILLSSICQGRPQFHQCRLRVPNGCRLVAAEIMRGAFHVRYRAF